MEERTDLAGGVDTAETPGPYIVIRHPDWSCNYGGYLIEEPAGKSFVVVINFKGEMKMAPKDLMVRAPEGCRCHPHDVLSTKHFAGCPHHVEYDGPEPTGGALDPERWWRWRNATVK